jgi:YD repeat-containing protein
VRGVASDHPGSAGGYKAQSYEYDIMGRLVRHTNPTEINGDWEAKGDDPVWVWTSQAYDWQGRETVSTNQDGTTRSTSYEGCGCSGGDVVTLTDEGTLVNGTLQRRKQKIYHDVLGRVVKSEIYDWNNNVYTTTTQAYNALDQTTTITRQQGGGGPSQVTTFGYDGYGRLSTRQFPNASAPSSFVYNADDTLQTVTDARGASSSFSYNNRHLVTGITYGAPGGVAATPNVTYSYDEAGNRTSMTDGLGSATYHYDTLSRMDWETRGLTGVGSFTINYAYNLGGQLTSVTDPANDSVSYVYDRTGQIAAINGSNYGGVTQYASGLQFRAWGGLKALSYGNGLSLVNSYNTRLQLQQMEVKGFASSGSPSLMKVQYQYYPDGAPKFAQNLVNSRFDRAWTYDHVGRLSDAYTGQEADNYAGVNVPSPQTGPYRHTHQYDAWDNLTSRTGRYWSQTSDFTTTYNGHNQRQGWTYDAAGNLLNDRANQYTYDAAGRNVSSGGVTQAFDGLGQVIKNTDLNNNVTYYLHSTPLGGGVLTELYGTPGSSVPVGIKIRGYVYAGGVVIAKQVKSEDDYTNSSVEWKHQDPLTGSLATSGNVTTNNGDFARQQEMDPMGVNVGLMPPLPVPPAERPEGMRVAFYTVPEELFPGGRCTLDKVDVSCDLASRLLGSGAAGLAPEQTVRYNFTTKMFEFFQVKQDGSGWADSKGNWVHEEKTSSSFRTRIATEDVMDEDGNIIIHKGEEVVDMIIEGKDHWEYSGTEYVNLPVGEFIGGGGGRGQTSQPPQMKPGQKRHCDRLAELMNKIIDGSMAINQLILGLKDFSNAVKSKLGLPPITGQALRNGKVIESRLTIGEKN